VGQGGHEEGESDGQVPAGVRFAMPAGSLRGWVGDGRTVA
jgi:hypothetical protein